MDYALTIRKPGNLLGLTLQRDITEDQVDLIKAVLRSSDLLPESDMLRLAGSINLALLTMGNGIDPWDAPEGAGESVEAFRG